MTIDQKFIDQFVNVTSKAAISSYQLVGKNDKVAADFFCAFDRLPADPSPLFLNLLGPMINNMLSFQKCYNLEYA